MDYYTQLYVASEEDDLKSTHETTISLSPGDSKVIVLKCPVYPDSNISDKINGGGGIIVIAILVLIYAIAVRIYNKNFK